MKYYLFLLFLMTTVIVCTPTRAYKHGNPKRYEIIDAYKHFSTDDMLEAIDYHYISMDGDPDAYGHIIMDNPDVYYEFSVDIYKDDKGLYLYEWDPDTGHEYKRYLTKDQRKYVIKL